MCSFVQYFFISTFPFQLSLISNSFNNNNSELLVYILDVFITLLWWPFFVILNATPTSEPNTELQ